jgi:hypothetical protein
MPRMCKQPIILFKICPYSIQKKSTISLTSFLLIINANLPDWETGTTVQLKSEVAYENCK